MKLTAAIRPITATESIEVSGEDYVTTRDQLLASVPEGYEIVGPISTVKDSDETVPALLREHVAAGV